MAKSNKSYAGRSVKELESIRSAVAVHMYDNDFLDRARARNEVEKIDKALVAARKREKKLSNPTIKSSSGWIKASAVKISHGKLLIKR